MALKKITIPAAGKSQSFNMTGLSVMILTAPSYTDITKAAKLSFNNPGAGLPVISGAIWPSDEGKFDNITITGTADSAGDEVTLMTVNNCLEAKLPLPNLGVSKAICGTTFTKAMNGTVQSLSDLEIVNAEGLLPSKIYISAAGKDIHYRFDSNPSEGGSDHVLIAGAVPLAIEGIDFIQKLRFINAVAAETPSLVVSLEY